MPEQLDTAADERALVAQAAGEENMTYPCYLDPAAHWAQGVGVDRTPSFAVIDAGGRIVYRARGLLEEGTPEFAQLEAAIEHALAAAPPRH